MAGPGLSPNSFFAYQPQAFARRESVRIRTRLSARQTGVAHRESVRSNSFFRAPDRLRAPRIGSHSNSFFRIPRALRAPRIGSHSTRFVTPEAVNSFFRAPDRLRAPRIGSHSTRFVTPEGVNSFFRIHEGLARTTNRFVFDALRDTRRGELILSRARPPSRTANRFAFELIFARRLRFVAGRGGTGGLVDPPRLEAAIDEGVVFRGSARPSSTRWPAGAVRRNLSHE